jgi:hypothetical protein
VRTSSACPVASSHVVSSLMECTVPIRSLRRERAT